MRMPHNKLFAVAVADVIEIKVSFFFFHLCMENNLKKNVPQLFLKLIGIILINGFHRLIGFLNKILSD